KELAIECRLRAVLVKIRKPRRLAADLQGQCRHRRGPAGFFCRVRTWSGDSLHPTVSAFGSLCFRFGCRFRFGCFGRSSGGGLAAGCMAAGESIAHERTKMQMIEDAQRLDRIGSRHPLIFYHHQIVAVALLAAWRRFDDPVNTFALGKLKSVTTNLWCS